MYTKSYVTEEGAKAVRAYKYKGSDNSLVYKYIVSPLAQKFVDHLVPEWLAPNLITAIGFLMALIAHLIVWATLKGTVGGEYESWLPLLCGVCTSIYFFLDNVDGKQARKTGTSSPLGLLFDHGVDALMPLIVGTNIFAMVQGGNGYVTIFGFILAEVSFLIPTWEEYYVGSLDLPIINGAMEGIVILISIFFFSAGVGGSWWTVDLFGIPRNGYALLALVGAALPLVAMSFHKVYWKLEGKGFGKALSKLGTSGMIIFTLTFVSLFSPTNVLARKARFMCYIAGISHAKLMTNFQIAHVANQEINQKIYSIWIPQILLLGNTVLGIILGQPLINEDLLINALFGFVLLAYGAFVVKVINEFTSILGISAFTIKPKVKDQ